MTQVLVSVCSLLLVLLTLQLPGADAYSLGPPVPFVAALCENMTPHPVAHQATPQTSPSPYIITTNAVNGYIPNRVYTVAISRANDSVPDFKGFFCQVRQVNGSTAFVGSFESFDTEKAQILPCPSGKCGIGHKSPEPKVSFTMPWKAPGKGHGSLYAVCSVVQSLQVFWIQIQSIPFDELDSPTELPAPTEMPTEDSDLMRLIREYFFKWKAEFEEWQRAFQDWEDGRCPAINGTVADAQ
eukprot:m.6972 g.6972  ORF g.6972 m.6972 type:complete len:241 (+) comp17370_c0_seq1:93-815(+)